MGLWTDVVGTVRGYIRLGLTGVRLKNSSGALAVRNAGDSAYANVECGDIYLGPGNKLVFEGTTDDAYETTVDPGDPTADRTLTLPNKSGTLAVIESGTILQVVEGTPYTTYSSTGTAIPNDDTIPQNTEGAEWATVTITPTNASNRLRIEASAGLISTSGTLNVTGALFQDSTANALAAAQVVTTAAGYTYPLNVTHEMAAGTTSATTFKFRMGPVSGTLYVNGVNTGRLLGGVSAVRIRVMEIKV